MLCCLPLHLSLTHAWHAVVRAPQKNKLCARIVPHRDGVVVPCGRDNPHVRSDHRAGDGLQLIPRRARLPRHRLRQWRWLVLRRVGPAAAIHPPPCAAGHQYHRRCVRVVCCVASFRRAVARWHERHGARCFSRLGCGQPGRIERSCIDTAGGRAQRCDGRGRVVAVGCAG